MKISEEFPSKYLKAADLQGREVKVVMQNVEKEKLGDDTKLVLYFKGKDKGVVLNKTNSSTISDAYGDDTEDWFDQPLILFSVMVDFQGKVGPAIRCRVPTAKDNRQGRPEQSRRPDPISSGLDNEPPPHRESARNPDLDDSIPF
jgi:hypothetical protein